jgi:hypothetical protein
MSRRRDPRDLEVIVSHFAMAAIFCHDRSTAPDRSFGREELLREALGLAGPDAIPVDYETVCPFLKVVRRGARGSLLLR